MKLKLMFILMLFFSCKENNNVVESYEKVERFIIDNGHVETYEHYKNMSLLNKKNSIYTCSVIMAYKYNYLPAYHDCYMELLSLNNKNRFFTPSTLLKMNTKQKELVEFHLINGAKLKNFDCMSSLHYIYHYKLLENKNKKFCDSLKKEILIVFPEYRVDAYLE